MTPLRRQRGVALMMAILIVALATILATQIGFDSVLEQRRTAGMLGSEHAFQIGLGAEAWAAHFLQQDLATPSGDRRQPQQQQQQDHYGEDWAQPMPPIPVEGGQIEGQLEDLQGRFNLNNLVDDQGGADQESRALFERLLTLLELEPHWTDKLIDWLDRDEFAGEQGAEDEVYTSLTPPYRAANRKITSVSELLALPEFGVERYRKLRPHVTALPARTVINTCTASGVLIDALNGNEEVFSRDPEALARLRATEGCFPREARDPQFQQMVGNSSRYFRLTALITLGDMEFSLYSLLNRRDDGRVSVADRSFTAE